jgi:hypothetical protein
MLSQKCLNELKNNCKNEIVSFSMIRGAYISEGQIISNLNSKFLVLPEDEQYKYAAVARTIFTAKPEEKILEIPSSQDSPLKRLYNTGLTDDAAVEETYEAIIESFTNEPDRYLILLMEDFYDVKKVNTAGEDLDESENTYHYIICAICPVELSKPGIECLPTGICLRRRDWIMAKPKIGIVYPAFINREPDEGSYMYYAAKPKETHRELMINFLNAEPRTTITQKIDSLEHVISSVLINSNNLNSLERITDGVHEMINVLVGDEPSEENCGVLLKPEDMEDILLRLGVRDSDARKVANVFRDQIEIDMAKLFLDPKRAARYRAYASHQRSRDLLDRSKSALDAAGQKDLADEIENYMERTR